MSIHRPVIITLIAGAVTMGLATADDYRLYRPGPAERADTDRSYSGIEGARIAHSRLPERRAERADGACESFVSVEYGETLSDIAEYCDVPVAALIDANPRIDPHWLEPGEVIRVPAIAGAIYDGETRYIYRGLPYTDRYLAAGALEQDARGKLFYSVRRGDTLAQISETYAVPLREIAARNPHLRPRQLAVGERVYLPDYAADAPPARRTASLAARYAEADPLVSIYPDRGPRDGEILIVGDGFKRGGEVSIYLGRSAGDMTRIRVVEADGDGRIRERLRLPADYDHDTAYWAARPAHGDYVLSEAFKVERGDAYQRRWANARYWPELSVVEKRGRAPGEVAVVATGFPPEAHVSVFAGPDRESLRFIGSDRADLRGEARLETLLPDNLAGRTVFVARIDDPVAGAMQATTVQHVQASRYPYALQQAASLEADLAGGDGFFDRFKRRARELLAKEDFVEGPHVVDRAGLNAASLSGVIAEKDGRCIWLREDDGAYRALYGRFTGFGPGDRVVVTGVSEARTRHCGAGAMRVTSVDWAPL